MKSKWMLMTTAIVALASVIIALRTNDVSLDDGGYTNLLIAIDDDIEEDEAIIDGLREIFTEGSARLFNATKHFVYFRSISILVPLNWTRGSYERAQKEDFEQADIKIIENSDEKPSVTQVSVSCENQGLEMHINPRYISNKTVAENKYGKRDKTLVRLWAKLRWGVFDEHYEKAHLELNNSVKLTKETRCSALIKGTYQINSEICKEEAHTQSISQECQFIPDQNGQTATASLMFDTGRYDIHSVTQFCHSDNNSPEGFHNRLPQNLQNIRCDSLSVWDVMLKSADFTGKKALPISTPTTPEIRVVRHGGIRRVVLVLDISGSMGGEKFLSMIQASTNYLQYIVPNGVFVAVVTFETKSMERSGFVEITDQGRMDLVNALPTSTGGSTCLGCGIEMAIDILQRNNEGDSNGAYIILLSDGIENVSPYITNTLPWIDQSSVIIDTIAFTEYADLQLQDLSERTAGYPAVCSLKRRVGCVNSAFISSVSKRPQIFPPSLITHVSLISMIPPNSTKVVDFAIDSSAGNGMIMTVAWTLYHDIILVSARSPSGIVIDDTNGKYNADSAIKMITIQVDDGEAGIWTLEITNSDTDSATVGVSVNSKPRSISDKPPVVNAFVGSTHIEINQKPVVDIYALVHINYEPVLEADVIAQIESASGDSHTIRLLDKGKGPDLFQDDGIYSGNFQSFTTNGQYGVEVYVNGSTHQSSFVDTTGGRFQRDAETPFSLFTRTTSGGSFQVTGYVPDSTIDILAPSKITDLRSADATYNEDRTVELMWTAVGDDLDHGTASHYELRYSTDFDTLLDKWTACTQIQASDILAGRLSPVAPTGTKEYITIGLPDNRTADTYFFAIRAWDESNNVGGLSNIVTVVPRPPPPIVTTTDPPPTESTESSSNVPSSTDVPATKRTESPSIASVAPTTNAPPTELTGSSSSVFPSTNAPTMRTESSSSVPLTTNAPPTESTKSSSNVPSSTDVPATKRSESPSIASVAPTTNAPPTELTGYSSSVFPSTNAPTMRTESSSSVPPTTNAPPTESTKSSSRVPPTTDAPTTKRTESASSVLPTTNAPPTESTKSSSRVPTPPNAPTTESTESSSTVPSSTDVRTTKRTESLSSIAPTTNAPPTELTGSSSRVPQTTDAPTTKRTESPFSVPPTTNAPTTESTASSSSVPLTTNAPTTNRTESSYSVPSTTNAPPTGLTGSSSSAPPMTKSQPTEFLPNNLSTTSAIESTGSSSNVPSNRDMPSSESTGHAAEVPPSQPSRPTGTLPLIISISVVFGLLFILAAFIRLSEYKVRKRNSFELDKDSSSFGCSDASTNGPVVVVSCKNPTFNGEV